MKTLIGKDAKISLYIVLFFLLPNKLPELISHIVIEYSTCLKEMLTKSNSRGRHTLYCQNTYCTLSITQLVRQHHRAHSIG